MCQSSYEKLILENYGGAVSSIVAPQLQRLQFSPERRLLSVWRFVCPFPLGPRFSSNLRKTYKLPSL